MPQSTRAGDLLAGRYRLVDLLSESRGAHFWRAWDTVLSRHVAVHLIKEADERADLLMDAARRSATLFDPHLLRVLDADHTDGTCFVVNEWGEGDSLDHLLNDGPLSPRRAAWLVAEVGSMIASAHASGIAHGRLVPENVLIDEAGSVKVIGFAVDAALNGMPEGRVRTDVVDLAAVLYAALTGKWPGISRSAVPPAPQEHGRPLRPRQVRAGVPRALDALCDEVLSPFPGPADRGFDSARSIVEALEEYVGDLAAVAEAEAADRRGNTNPRLPRIDAPLALAPDMSPGAAAAAAASAAGAVGDGDDASGDDTTDTTDTTTDTDTAETGETGETDTGPDTDAGPDTGSAPGARDEPVADPAPADATVSLPAPGAAAGDLDAPGEPGEPGQPGSSGEAGETDRTVARETTPDEDRRHPSNTKM